MRKRADGVIGRGMSERGASALRFSSGAHIQAKLLIITWPFESLGHFLPPLTFYFSLYIVEIWMEMDKWIHI